MRSLSIFRTSVGQALRAVRRRPATALVSVGILGGGIGASVAVFSVVSAVLLEPLPYDRPERLFLVEHREADGASPLVAAPEAAAYAGARSVGGIGFLRDVRDGTLSTTEGAEAVRLGVASPSLFGVLGIRPVAGRLPSDPPPASTTGGGEAMVSHAFWRDRLGGVEAGAGATVVVDGAPLIVVGVLPADFHLALPPSAGIPPVADVWMSLPVPLEEFRRPDRLRDQDSDNRGVVVARLADGVDPAVAAAELTGVRRRLMEQQGEPAGLRAAVALAPLKRAATAAARPVLLALLAAVVLVLLLTAANVAALLLSRSAERTAELSVRSALGAGRSELAGLIAGEGALIGAAAGVLGLLVGAWGRDLLLRLHPDSLGSPHEAAFDVRILAFAAVATLLATVVATAIPAWRAARPGTLSSLRSDAGSTRSGAAGARRLLVSAEIACALALLVGAGLLTRTAFNLAAVDPGFDAAPVTTFELALIDPTRYRGPADRGGFVRGLAERLEAEPAVAAAGVIGGIPLGGETFTQPWGRPDEPPEGWRGEANFRVVSDGYFDAVATGLLAGRAFRPDDDRQDVRVVIVDRALATELAGGVAEASPPDVGPAAPADPARAALGRTIAIPLDGRREVATIVGVVENVRFDDLRAPGAPTVYVPYRHEASRRITVAVRSTTGEALPRALIEDLVAASDPDLPVFAYAPMREHVRRATAETRFALGVFASFALLAALLAAVGVYAVVARWVAARTPEIGIRMALGADRRRVARLVLGETLLLIVPGLAAGLLLAAVLATSARALLFGVTPLDPVVLASVTALLASAAIAAAILPARRAAGLPPSAALRV